MTSTSSTAVVFLMQISCISRRVTICNEIDIMQMSRRLVADLHAVIEGQRVQLMWMHAMRPCAHVCTIKISPIKLITNDPSDLLSGLHFRFPSHCCPGIMSAQMRSTLILEFDLPLEESRPKNFNYMKNVDSFSGAQFYRANCFCVCVAGQWGQPC